MGLVIGLAVLGIITSRHKPAPVDNTASLLAESEEAKLALQKTLAEIKLTERTGGKRVFNDLGWQVYLSQFDPETKEATSDCRKDMETCPGWQTIATGLGVDEFDVKFTYYFASDVALDQEKQKLYDEFDALVQTTKPQTNEADAKLMAQFATKHELELHELYAIDTCGSLYQVRHP